MARLISVLRVITRLSLSIFWYKVLAGPAPGGSGKSASSWRKSGSLPLTDPSSDPLKAYRERCGSVIKSLGVWSCIVLVTRSGREEVRGHPGGHSEGQGSDFVPVRLGSGSVAGCDLLLQVETSSILTELLCFAGTGASAGRPVFT